MAFTNLGKMYRLLVDNIPVGTNASKGVRIGTLINMEPGEKVIAATSLHRNTNAEYVLFITKQGLVKKTLLEEYTFKEVGTTELPISLDGLFNDIEIIRNIPNALTAKGITRPI